MQTIFEAYAVEGDYSTNGIVDLHYHIGVDNTVCFRDHLVFGQPVLGTDGYIELIYSATKQYFGEDLVELRDIVINKPLCGTPGKIYLVCVNFKKTADGQRRFTVKSRVQSEQTWQLHVRGFTAPIPELKPSVAANFSVDMPSFGSVSDVPADQLKDIELKTFYNNIIESLTYQGEKAFGIVNVTHEPSRNYVNQLTGGALMCAMTFGATGTAKEDVDLAEMPYLPYKIKKVNIYGPSEKASYNCFVSRERYEGNMLEFNVKAFNDKREVALAVEGLQLLSVSKSQLIISGAEGSVIHEAKATSTGKAWSGKQKIEECSDVAIIGLSCRLPGADNVDEFWTNLCNGVESISELDQGHWGGGSWFNPNPQNENTSYSKWAGLIKDSDKFDPSFFGISLSEAEIMDPQQRVFLEECWRALEDGGYARPATDGSNISVFVGAGTSDYLQHLQATGNEKRGEAFMGTSQGILASRISYFLNLTGPALAIDTACSSSLVAIERAYQSVITGESEMALAGGVSLLTTPNGHIWTSQVGMPSHLGKCRAFDDQADGIVSSEGVGVVLMKRLKDAEKDGDIIYAVIKGAGINQDGKTNGITAPSARAQSALERLVYQKYNINPSTINYVEAHGTGTKLGDPVEFRALCSSFESFGATEKQFCALGSVKTNIGHCGYASGVAGVVKAILMLQHRKYPPTIHFNTINRELDIESSPFYVNTDLRDWVIEETNLRRAAVSSFGFSGTNAHLVLEEYVRENIQEDLGDKSEVIVLSAKSSKALRATAGRLGDVLRNNSSIHLSSLAYSLQLFKAEMEERVAFVVSSVEALIEHLDGFVVESTDNSICGTAKGHTSKTKSPINAVGNITDPGDWEAVARQWVVGARIDWNTLYTNYRPARIRLPTYPFVKQKCWVTGPETSSIRGKRALHPLLHQNISDLDGVRFETTFSGEEQFLMDHLVNGNKVLPGVAYLELIREASRRVMKVGIWVLASVKWVRPMIVSENSQEIHVAVNQNEGGIYVSVFTSRAAQKTVYCEAKLRQQDELYPPSRVDIPTLLAAECLEIPGEKIYAEFGDVGLKLGDSYKRVQKLFVGKGYTLARIRTIPMEGCAYSPGTLDSVLHTIYGFFQSEEKAYELTLPYKIGRVEFWSEINGLEMVWGYAKVAKSDPDQKHARIYDVDLLDDSGNVLVRLLDVEVVSGVDSKVNSWGLDVAIPELYTVDWTPKAAGSRVGSGEPLIWVINSDNQMIRQLGTDLQVAVESITALDEIRFFTKVMDKVASSIRESRSQNLIIVCHLADYIKYAFVSGLLRTARQEYSRFHGKVLAIDDLSPDNLATLRRILEIEIHSAETEVRYVGGIRQVRDFKNLLSQATPVNSPVKLKSGGTYVVIGGMGVLGRTFQEHLHKSENVNVVVLGRRTAGEIEKLGLDTSFYYCCDVCDKTQLGLVLHKIRKRFKHIDGILHLAGCSSDKAIVHKSYEEAINVLRPKIIGTKNLDSLTAEDHLDFFLVFSSIGGVVGNVGQADYSAANAYLDNYVSHRNSLRESGLRRGISLSINWPYWDEGGMNVPAETISNRYKILGLQKLSIDGGLKAFDAICHRGFGQITVFSGNFDIFKRRFFHEAGKLDDDGSIVQDNVHLVKELRNQVIKLMAEMLKVNRSEIHEEETFGAYGFDSISFTKFVNRLNGLYDLSLAPTIFYNYPTVSSLCDHLVNEYRIRLDSEIGLRKLAIPVVSATENFQYPQEASDPVQKDNGTSNEAESEPVAIIGISGRFPGAATIADLWRHLENCEDLISEFPEDRLSVTGSRSQEQPGRVRWGGFISDMDKFDSLFFNISPKESELMDPQQRIVLEAVYNALEDAAIAARNLRGTNTGVFLGVAGWDYSLLLDRYASATSDPQFTTGSSHAVLVNRISYLLDLHGPSEPVDTACSSSLVAIGRAVDNIRSGKCNMAIAGGVNAILYPDISDSFAQAGMLSPDGRCKSFDQSANGYVRSEGTGILILKSLKQAVADGDRIYAVIKAVSVNHGGKANTLTAPGALAQRDVLLSAYRSADIDPRDVTLIEAHGTGTALGDPIEIEGLTSAFRQMYLERGISQDPKFNCAIGSVKSNIGHLEAAAGVAGVIKVVLSMVNQKIPGNPHLKEPNSYIDLGQTPFYLQAHTTKWETPDGRTRVAGVSSFGFGGTNAHLILQEYVQSKPVHIREDTYYPIMFSTKTAEQLLKMVRNFSDFLDKGNEIRLVDIAYTLQVGRDHFKERIAFTVKSVQELREELHKYLYTNDNRALPATSLEKTGPSGLTFQKSFIDGLLMDRQLQQLTDLWKQGVEIGWKGLYVGESPRKISLPGYPFSRIRCWLPTDRSQLKVSKKLNPLLHFIDN